MEALKCRESPGNQERISARLDHLGFEGLSLGLDNTPTTCKRIVRKDDAALECRESRFELNMTLSSQKFKPRIPKSLPPNLRIVRSLGVFVADPLGGLNANHPIRNHHIYLQAPDVHVPAGSDDLVYLHRGGILRRGIEESAEEGVG